MAFDGGYALAFVLRKVFYAHRLRIFLLLMFCLSQGIVLVGEKNENEEKNKYILLEVSITIQTPAVHLLVLPVAS